MDSNITIKSIRNNDDKVDNSKINGGNVAVIVTREQRKKLLVLKANKGFSSLSELIGYLLDKEQ